MLLGARRNTLLGGLAIVAGLAAGCGGAGGPASLPTIDVAKASMAVENLPPVVAPTTVGGAGQTTPVTINAPATNNTPAVTVTVPAGTFSGSQPLSLRVVPSNQVAQVVGGTAQAANVVAVLDLSTGSATQTNQPITVTLSNLSGAALQPGEQLVASVYNPTTHQFEQLPASAITVTAGSNGMGGTTTVIHLTLKPGQGTGTIVVTTMPINQNTSSGTI